MYCVKLVLSPIVGVRLTGGFGNVPKLPGGYGPRLKNRNQPLVNGECPPLIFLALVLTGVAPAISAYVAMSRSSSPVAVPAPSVTMLPMQMASAVRLVAEGATQ